MYTYLCAIARARASRAHTHEATQHSLRAHPHNCSMGARVEQIKLTGVRDHVDVMVTQLHGVDAFLPCVLCRTIVGNMGPRPMDIPSASICVHEMCYQVSALLKSMRKAQ
jgi:hypothetical protein